MKYLKSTACLAIIAGAFVAPTSTAIAQSASEALRQDVVIVSTKKPDGENVQDVAIAVTALNEDTLDALKVRNIESLSFTSPNVSLDDLGSTPGFANFSIRGLGINSSIPSIDPTVGVFVDGIYLGINAGVVFDTFDLDSVEILRGPQGLLFGRNTTGGAVVMNTGDPTDEFEAKVKVSTEGPTDSDRGGWATNVQGTVSGPLIAGTLNGKLALYANHDDGYFKNLFDGENVGESDTIIARGALEFLLSENVRVMVKGEVFDSDGDGPAGKNRGVFERDNFDFSIDDVGFYEAESETLSIRTDWDVSFGDGTITNIFGYRSFFGDNRTDVDALTAELFILTSITDQEQFSNELRYAGRFADRVDVTTGLYYFDQEFAYTEIRDIGPARPAIFAGGGAQDHTVFGAFAQADFEVNDNLILIGGLRYSKEEKDAAVTALLPRMAVCSVIDGSCPVDGFTDSDSWENLQPKLGVQYLVDDTSQIYATYTRGVRSGGYNFRLTNVPAFEARRTLTGQAATDEEIVDAYEAGFKHRSADNKLQLNIAAFFNDVSDIQRDLTIPNPATGGTQFVVNTADVEIMGLELETRYSPIDDLTLTANFGLTESEYSNVLFDISSDGVVDADDAALDLPRAPASTYGFGAIYDFDVGSLGSATARLNFQHKDRFAAIDSNEGWIDEVDMLDADLTWYPDWNTGGGQFGISLYGRNLLDEATSGGDFVIPFGGPLSTGGAEPLPYQPYPRAGTFTALKKGRRIGIELTATF